MNLKRIYSQIILVTLKPMIDRNITNVKDEINTREKVLSA